jgi:hypothetical protein
VVLNIRKTIFEMKYMENGTKKSSLNQSSCYLTCFSEI